jgi:hypothetical protein
MHSSRPSQAVISVTGPYIAAAKRGEVTLPPTARISVFHYYTNSSHSKRNMTLHLYVSGSFRQANYPQSNRFYYVLHIYSPFRKQMKLHHLLLG